MRLVWQWLTSLNWPSPVHQMYVFQLTTLHNLVHDCGGPQAEWPMHDMTVVDIVSRFKEGYDWQFVSTLPLCINIRKEKILQEIDVTYRNELLPRWRLKTINSDNSSLLLFCAVLFLLRVLSGMLLANWRRPKKGGLFSILVKTATGLYLTPLANAGRQIPQYHSGRCHYENLRMKRTLSSTYKRHRPMKRLFFLWALF